MEACTPNAMHDVALLLFVAFVLIVIVALAGILAGTQAGHIRRASDDEKAAEQAAEPASE